MSAVSFRLPDDVSARLQELAQRTGRSKTFCKVEAIREHLDDLEEVYSGRAELERPARRQDASRATGRSHAALWPGRLNWTPPQCANSASSTRKMFGPSLAFVHSRVAVLDDPRSIGETLKGAKLGELWEYRVGDCRTISRAP